MAVLCPECDTPLHLDIDEIEEGETISCDDCGVQLEILSLEPLKVLPVDDSGYDDPEETPFTRDEDDADDR